MNRALEMGRFPGMVIKGEDGLVTSALILVLYLSCCWGPNVELLGLFLANM